MKPKKLLFIFGTRPEAIKMAPVIIAAKNTNAFQVDVCTTGQHREMLQQVMDFFELRADYELNLMQPDQTLFTITANAISGLEKVLEDSRPDLVLVQGDTTTAFCGALAAYYKQIKVAHIEAGLRSFNKYGPFPEEINRKLVGNLADFHFAPTEQAVSNLKQEGINENVFKTGNTVIDALLWGVDKVREDKEIASAFSYLNPQKRIILVTAHRRESFGDPLVEVFEALLEVVKSNPEIQIVFPVHLNPNVRKLAFELLGTVDDVHLVDPLDYQKLLWILDKSTLVITDSGGIQEEAPSLGKPVLVIRDVTERMEGVAAGTAILVGTKKAAIVEKASMLLSNSSVYEKMSNAVNPYGTGNSAEQILSLLQQKLN